ncbi:MAG: PAS domain S-box protein [Deltaproteobacteria bacterium]|nr:PAS domain S-box protein [Deltaproteobacteria bacterium]
MAEIGDSRQELNRLRARNVELERAADKAKKIQADLEALIETTDDFILFADEKARPVVYNRNYARKMKQLLGVDMRPGFQPHTLLPPAERAYWDGLHGRVLSGEKFKAEYCYEWQGKERCFEISYNPVFQGDKVVSFSEYTRDITERKAMEHALASAQRRSEHDYRLLLEKMLDGVLIQEVIFGADGRPLDYRAIETNPAFERITGLSRGDVVGHTIRELLPSVDEAWLARIATVVETGESVRFETALDDLGLHLDIHAVKPHPGELVFIFQDVTHRKELEEQRQRSDRLQSVGLLAGGIAHDFNNILTALLGNVELARLGVAPTSDTGQMLAQAAQACERASALTKQLLTFARGGQPVKEPHSLGPLLEQWSSFALRGSSIRCELRVTDNLWSTEIDAGQISQVIHNLLINASQAMPRGGVVHVHAENMLISAGTDSMDDIESDASLLEPGRYVRLRVKDAGSGIPEELLPKIFDPYFTTKQGGSGLGLATCYAIVSNHHGTITATSCGGGGTTFELLLPATEGEVSIEQGGDPQLAGGAGRVLFMDDDAGIRAVAEGMLELLGYEVELTKDGQEAIDAYREAMGAGRPYLAVILDLTIPGGLGGRETLTSLRTLDPNVRAIVSSGYSNDPILANYREYGFTGMVAKPYRFKALAEVLEQVIAAT